MYLAITTYFLRISRSLLLDTELRVLGIDFVRFSTDTDTSLECIQTHHDIYVGTHDVQLILRGESTVVVGEYKQDGGQSDGSVGC